MQRLGALVTLALGACVTSLGHDTPGSRAGVVTADCLVPLRAALTGHGAPAAALEYEGRGSLWLWDDAAALVAGAAAACRGELTARPGPPVPLRPDEEAANAARTDGRRVATAPRGGFVAGGIGYLYYDLVLRGPGFFDVAPLGTGLCTLAAPDAPCARGPGLLWTATPPRGGAGFVDRDGLAYVFACTQPAALDDVCTAARVAPARAGDAGAYELAGAFGGWSPEPGTPAGALAGTDLISVGPSALLGGYLAVGRDAFAAQLRIAVADAPGGPYREDIRRFDAVSPPSFVIGGGLEHRALRAGAAELVVSYSSGSDLHLVTFHLDPEDWP